MHLRIHQEPVLFPVKLDFDTRIWMHAAAPGTGSRSITFPWPSHETPLFCQFVANFPTYMEGFSRTTVDSRGKAPRRGEDALGSATRAAKHQTSTFHSWSE